MEIDLVYTWCDGSEKNFLNKRNQYLTSTDIDNNPSIRFEHVNEIYWSIQTVLKFLPFVRKIFIVTDNQIPNIDFDWLYDGKVVIVDHTEIIPKDLLPVFYSDVIESYIHNIPGLSEIFIYSNDDCFHTKLVNKKDIIHYTSDGKIRLKIINNFNIDVIRKKTSEYSKRIILTADIFLSEDPSIQLINNHHSKILRKSTLKWMEKSCQSYLIDLRKNRFRTDNTIQYMFLALNIDNIMHNNIIMSNLPEADFVEYHFGNSDYDIDRHSARFSTVKKYKWCCYNSMNHSFKHVFENWIKEVLTS